MATTDLIQGPFGAQYLVQKAGKKNIAVIDDGKTYGAGLAEQFAEEAEKLGANVVAREKVGEKDTDFSGVHRQGPAVRTRTRSTTAVSTRRRARCRRSSRAPGLNVPLMGGDGIVDQQFVALGGRAGDLATNVGAPGASRCPAPSSSSPTTRRRTTPSRSARTARSPTTPPT